MACLLSLSSVRGAVHVLCVFCDRHPFLLANKIRFLRRKGMVGEFVSVYLHSVRRAVYIAR